MAAAAWQQQQQQQQQQQDAALKPLTTQLTLFQTFLVPPS
jgi:hypothetical protein